MTFIDNLLNKITMYRLMFYYLLALLGVAAIFGAVGIMPYNPVSLIVSTLILMLTCLATNALFAKIFRAQTNVESAYITSFILALIITPIALRPFDVAGFWFLIAAAVFAMASKYILAINKKHIFNPAAVAVALTAILMGQYASWWAGGNVPLLAFVVIGGLLVIRKIQRFDLILSFAVAAVASCVVTNLPFNALATAEKALVHTTLLFFAFVMLSEPLTTPPTRSLRILYGLFVGAIFAPGVHIGSIYSTPELALVAGNILSYAISPKGKYALKLKSKTKIGANIYDFVFETGANHNTSDGTIAVAKKISFAPGQYMEFTLAHDQRDSRGNRRYFTIASSPTEHDFHLGVRFHGSEGGRSSSFKKKMLALEPGATMMAGGLAGDFTLPKNAHEKLAFIAGGIGVTPFRSMVKYLNDKKEQRDIIFLYSNRIGNQIAYREIFEEATQNIGLKTVYAITNGSASGGQSGRIDADFIKREIPDYRERTFYLSGTHAMVVSFQKNLAEMGIPHSHIKSDFFPGFG